ncbi:phosphoribosyltransferase-like protein [Paludibaculum fermentans]|uniref:phosphoribosyltransferase-like protein n=1 Tax=Paludibaculum fermentans TaxID=1473598 RepID=UPI003EBDE897
MPTHQLNPAPTLDALEKMLASLMTVRPVAVLDGCLNALTELSRQTQALNAKKSEEHEARLLILFCKAAAAVAKCEGDPTASDPISLLLSREHSTLKRKEIALLFVRLFAAYPNVINSPRIAFRCFELFDEVLDDSVYRLAKVSRDAQTFQKASAIVDLVQRTERELDELLDSFKTLESLETFRSQYLKKLNSGTACLLIHPFISKPARDSDLSAIFKIAQEYAGCVGPGTIVAYRRAQALISRFIDDCKSIDGDYTERFCGVAAKRLGEVLLQHFQATPFSRPAALTVCASTKKYPLKSLGQSIPIAIQVRNSSDGVALEVQISVQKHSDNLSCSAIPLQIGGLEPGETLVEIAALVTQPSDLALLEIHVEWRNADDTVNSLLELLEVYSQKDDVDWESARLNDPYSLSPVSQFDILVGRDSIIESLLALTTNSDMGSAFIRGQKRVGKTSIAKTLQTRLLELHPHDYCVVYLEAGDYITPDGTSTIQTLGRQICRSIRRSIKSLTDLPQPHFIDALSPLTEYLEEITDRLPRHRLLFILDEFDELPLDLYKRGSLGDAFFRTIRSISSKSQFGFVLVGSEKMEYVLSNQGDSLNKFVKIPVDYFDKESQWNAFADLVRRPASAYLEYSDSAIVSIQAHSAGNPFFAKWICRSIYESMTEKRDSHVTEVEVARGVSKTIAEMGAHSVQYFWQDGIIDPPPRAEEIAVRRAKVLLSLTECVRNGEMATSSSIAKRAKGFGLDEHMVEHDLRSFERRKVLESRNGVYACKVRLFQDWLVSQGYYQILTTFVDQEGLSQASRDEETLRIKDEDILSLVDSWDLFLGRRISEQQIRSWLGQFATLEERHLMLCVLKGLHFYSADQIRAKLREAHGILTRGTTWHRRYRESTKRRDIIVTYLDGPGHSGAEYARRYGDENEIHPDNIVSIEQLQEAAKKRPDIKGVAMVDDFIGTGDTLSGLLTSHCKDLQEMSAIVEDKFFLCVICGLGAGVANVQNAIDRLGLRIRLHVMDTVALTGSVFGESSTAFIQEAQRNRARDVAYKYGLELLPDSPLGYGGSEATVVFENKVPNNCLPVLWVEKRGWRPLFRRL